MKTSKRFLTVFLAAVMLMGSFVLIAPPARAAVTTAAEDGTTSTVSSFLSNTYALKEDKLADMSLMRESHGYRLYVQKTSGEVAIQNVATGQTLFSNPYDINGNYNSAATATKYRLLSQVILTFLDNGSTKTMYSFEEAAMRSQIVIKNIKNGVRVEYAMGEQNVNYLVPRLIEKDRFESLILEPAQRNGISNYLFGRLKSFFILKDPNDPGLTDRLRTEMWNYYPITQTEYVSDTYEGYMAVYTIDSTVTQRELRELEDLIVTYCPKYTQEELEYDHELTHYEGNDEAPPLFRLALEYTIDEFGLNVTLPASSIRYDESRFTLSSVSVLPYFGATVSGVVSDKDDEGNTTVTYLDGYNFVPDGSGAVIRSKDLIGVNYSLTGDVYGTDFAYHTISSQHAESMSWPVFGSVVDYDATVYWETYDINEETGETKVTKHYQDVDEERGFLGVITEGESLAKITSFHGGLLHRYNSVYATYYPLPTDTYEIADAVTVSGGTASWTVTSERKYTGNFTTKYIMLTGRDAAVKAGLDAYYDCSYFGMAAAYRDYLYRTGVLSRLTDTEATLPLFIESFGSIVTVERVLSFPVDTDTPLTTFENVRTMYDQLAGARFCETCGTYVFDDDGARVHGEECAGELRPAGVTNLAFRLTGFYNGGVVNTYPAKLKWVKALGGEKGYKELLAYAQEKGFDLYPDFDFAYIKDTTIFDGITLRGDAVKTIDNRYSVKRYYDAATQTFQRTKWNVVSASVFSKFYDKLSAELLAEYEAGQTRSISVASFGTELNSDFDDDDPYNREDAKKLTSDVLEKISRDFDNVMTDLGNAYTLPYVDVILHMPTDSSRYSRAAEAIPFFGLVLHGSRQYAGDAINMEGDMATAILKAIENGADPYFILSYQNTTRLKEDEDMSKYYSVAYDIWRDSMMEVYNTLNGAIGDKQGQWITGHEFLTGMRVPTEKELQAGADASDASRFRTADGTIVMVTYEDGTSFVLNYNSYEVTVEVGGVTYAIGSLDFVKIG